MVFNRAVFVVTRQIQELGLSTTSIMDCQLLCQKM